jgi:hypothetical protein
MPNDVVEALRQYGLAMCANWKTLIGRAAIIASGPRSNCRMAGTGGGNFISTAA